MYSHKEVRYKYRKNVEKLIINRRTENPSKSTDCSVFNNGNSSLSKQKIREIRIFALRGQMNDPLTCVKRTRVEKGNTKKRRTNGIINYSASTLRRKLKTEY